MISSLVYLAMEHRPWLHILLHFVLPLILAVGICHYCSRFRINAQWLERRLIHSTWLAAWLLLMITMLVDIDHFLATPLYAPNRCSIGFHPLHQMPAIMVYVLMVVVPLILLIINRTFSISAKIVFWLGLGLVLHMLLDGLDCLWMQAPVV
ncbi:DUF6122 family protein [Bermanella sp. R86510]|uniref:DUF6122 family protein n=1 Tax=unclassified Bermanella TaxID=2627862 RepID=UPI0037C71326